jgi:hypothetical protein
MFRALIWVTGAVALAALVVSVVFFAVVVVLLSTA